MNASFKIGKVKRLVGGQDAEVDAELITLSGGYLSAKDDFTREATAEDKILYGAEYAEFKKSLEPAPE